MGPLGYCAPCFCLWIEENPGRIDRADWLTGAIHGPGKGLKPPRDAVTTVAGTAVCAHHVQHEMRLRPVDHPRFASSCAFGGAAS